MKNPVVGWKNTEIKAALEAHAKATSDLNIWGAVLTLMESSRLSGAEYKAESQVVKLCKGRMQACLTRLDKAAAIIVKANP